MDEIKDSEKLCQEIAGLSEGVCILGFSRGKDSIASWIQLKKYFKKIIPFHCATAPHLSFVDESLKYYEKIFNTKIMRCQSGAVVKAVSNLVYQPIEDEDKIDSLEFRTFNNNDIADWIRVEYKIPSAWVAYGINASDSIDRRIYVNKYKGRIDSHKSFYPCYDWKKYEILNLIKENNIQLAKGYLLSNRTLSEIPCIRHLERMDSLFPDDFKKVESVFPFIRAQMARNEFRKIKEA